MIVFARFIYNAFIAVLNFIPQASASSEIYTSNTRDSVVHSVWLGFKRTDFTLDGRKCIVVEPLKEDKTKPWIWRMEFFGHEPQADSMLLSLGFHVVYMDVQDMYGAPVAIDHLDQFYNYLVKKQKLNKKPVLEGFSRGGLFALNWAVRHPNHVSCLYLDAPVCDFKSWPAGKGKSEGSPENWKELIAVYGFKNEEQALAFKGNPVDNLEPLAKAHIPILSVCGGDDDTVPVAENTGLVEQRYKALNGKIEVIIKPGVKHHPHSLKDPSPIVRFILESGLK